MRILAVNAGSSSLKLRVLDDDDSVSGSADLRAPRGAFDVQAVTQTIEGFGSLDAVGHRIVHGGTEFVEPVVIDRRVERRLRSLIDLAPLHQPVALEALDAVNHILPDVPAIACFDTAFHAAMPGAATTYALPAEWRKKWKLKRYGFHGLSHAYASQRAAEILEQDPGTLRAVTAHLGAGASLAAVRGGRSVDTTMGFTPLEGLVMATRSGTVDPGLVLWLAEHAGMPTSELAATLEHRSGLLGLAGTADMRAILEGRDAGDVDATLAVDVYLQRLRAGIAAMAAAMDGLDAVVFTGGIGENSPAIRAGACDGLAFLGLGIDSRLNESGRGDRDIGASGAGARALVIEAREDLQIAREVRTVLARF